jgi:hypothetical protein
MNRVVAFDCYEPSRMQLPLVRDAEDRPDDNNPFRKNVPKERPEERPKRIARKNP